VDYFHVICPTSRYRKKENKMFQQAFYIFHQCLFKTKLYPATRLTFKPFPFVPGLPSLIKLMTVFSSLAWSCLCNEKQKELVSANLVGKWCHIYANAELLSVVSLLILKNLSHYS